MPTFIQIIDDNGNPDPIKSLADTLVEAILTKGVGFFRTESHVEKDIRTAVEDLLTRQVVVVNPPVILKECPLCGKRVSIWHTHSDGSVACTECK